MADGVEMDTKPDYDFHLNWYSRLAQRQADLEKEKNGSRKTTMQVIYSSLLLKECQQDQVKVKRILQKLGHDFEADKVEANGKHPDEETPSSSCSGSNGENHVSGDDDDHLHIFRHLDLVWAKLSGTSHQTCEGFRLNIRLL